MLPHPQENDLSLSFVRRWTPRRKAALVEAINGKKIALKRPVSDLALRAKSFAAGSLRSKGMVLPGCE